MRELRTSSDKATSKAREIVAVYQHRQHTTEPVSSPARTSKVILQPCWVAGEGRTQDSRVSGFEFAPVTRKGEGLQKTKTVNWDGLRFTIDTVVETASRKIELQGQPVVVIYDDFIQMGCMRITKAAMKRLAEYAEGLPDGYVADGLVIQPGNYPTNDPNAKSGHGVEGKI